MGTLKAVHKLFIILILKYHFLSLVVLEPYQNQRRFFSGDWFWNCRTRRDKEQSAHCPFALYSRQYHPTFVYYPSCFSTSAQDGITLKSQGHLSHCHQKWPGFRGHRGSPRELCLQLTDTLSTPDPAAAWTGTEVCSLTSPPVISFPRMEITGHHGIGHYPVTLFEGLSVERLSLVDLLNNWWAKISELKETPHRKFLSFSCFYSLFNMYNFIYSFNKYLLKDTGKVPAAKELPS